jgi:tetratricopeptide (TPR) repeat protein
MKLSHRLALRRPAARASRHASGALAIAGAFLGIALGMANAAETTPLTEAPPPIAPETVREALVKGDKAAALDLVRKEIQRQPGSPDLGALRILEARLLKEQADRVGAESAYRAAVDDSVWAKTALAELHEMMLGRAEFDRAEELLGWAGARAPQPAIELLRARSLYAQGRFHAALAGLVNAGASSDTERVLLEANLRLVLGEIDAAEKLYDEVVRESKDLRAKALAHYGKAQVARLRGARAIRVLENERALLEWTAPWAELDAAIALRELGRGKESKEKLLELIDETPVLDVPARLLLSRLADEAGNTAQAKEELAVLLRGDISDALAMASLGDIDLRGRRIEEGIFLLRSAAEAFPDFAPFRQRLMRAWIDRGSAPDPGFEPMVWDVNVFSAGEDLIEGNLPYFGIVADRDSMPPEDPRRLLVALTHSVSGNPAGVIAWSEGATPGAAGLIVARAFAFANLGRKEEAIALLGDLVQAGRHSWLSEELRMRLLYPDQREQAEEIARAILQARPRDARFRMRLARLRENAEDLDGAIAALREARDAGWITISEKRKLRDRLEDLEDLARSKESQPQSGAKAATP